MSYPSKAVRKGDARTDVVTQLQQRLNEIGCGPVNVDGIFASQTESAVKLFQTRRNLQADGVVGPMTWHTLFGDAPAPVTTAPSPLLAEVVAAALSQNGIRESGGRNRGPEVDGYIRNVGLDPAGGYSWCQAFVYWCFTQAAAKVALANPCRKTAGVLDHWVKAPAQARVGASSAFDDPNLIRPGAIFIVDHGGGFGHTGIVTRAAAGEILTLEGNTNDRGSREGDGVYQKTRTVGSINIGFIDYAR